MQCLYDNVADARNALPVPVHDPLAWLEFMKNEADGWHALVDKLFYVQSCLDRQAQPVETVQLTFVCDICANPKPAFCTAKALAQHKRIKHKMRSNIRCYIDDSGVCPCCKNTYHTRYRVLTHLQNPKKPECKDYILNSGRVSMLPSEFVQKLDVMDNIAIREARKQGFTHPKIKKPARRADGACIGCVRT